METGEENRGGEGTPPGVEGDPRRPAPIYTQENYKERSKAIGETKIAIARGKHPEVKGEYGTVIGLIVEDEKGKPVAAGVRNVDGIQAKAHQIYSMTKEREWVEVQK